MIDQPTGRLRWVIRKKGGWQDKVLQQEWSYQPQSNWYPNRNPFEREWRDVPTEQSEDE